MFTQRSPVSRCDDARGRTVTDSSTIDGQHNAALLKIRQDLRCNHVHSASRTQSMGAAFFMNMTNINERIYTHTRTRVVILLLPSRVVR